MAEALTGIGKFGHRDVKREDSVKTDAEWRDAPQVPGLLLPGTRWRKQMTAWWWEQSSGLRAGVRSMFMWDPVGFPYGVNFRVHQEYSFL